MPFLLPVDCTPAVSGQVNGDAFEAQFLKFGELLAGVFALPLDIGAAGINQHVGRTQNGLDVILFLSYQIFFQMVQMNYIKLCTKIYQMFCFLQWGIVE